MTERIFCKKRFMKSFVGIVLLVGGIKAVNYIMNSKFLIDKCTKEFNGGYWTCGTSDVYFYSLMIFAKWAIIIFVSLYVVTYLYNYYFPEKRKVKRRDC